MREKNLYICVKMLYDFSRVWLSEYQHLLSTLVRCVEGNSSNKINSKRGDS